MAQEGVWQERALCWQWQQDPATASVQRVCPPPSLRAVDSLKRTVLGARGRLGTPSKHTQAANDLGVGNCGTSIFPVVVTPVHWL